MRTTLTLEDDLFDELNQRSALHSKSFKDTVNETLKLGLGLVSQQASVPFRVVPFEGGLLPGIDPDRLNRLNDELEADAFLERQRRAGAE